MPACRARSWPRMPPVISGWEAAHAAAAVLAPKKLMYPQHTDADGPAHSPLLRPTYTTAVAGSHVPLARSTSTVIGSPVDGSADSITAGRPVIADMPRASIAHMANTVALPAICTWCRVGWAANGYAAVICPAWSRHKKSPSASSPRTCDTSNGMAYFARTAMPGAVPACTNDRSTAWCTARRPPSAGATRPRPARPSASSHDGSLVSVPTARPGRSLAGAGPLRAHPIAGRRHRDTVGMTCSAAAPARRTGRPRRSAAWASLAYSTARPRPQWRSPRGTPRHPPGAPGRSRAVVPELAHSGSPARPALSDASTCRLLPGLPRQVPVDPHQRRPDHRALVPAPCDDFTADRLSGAAQPLAHHRRLIVPRPAAQEMDAVDADTHLGMVAQVDQGVLGAVLAAAPACALAFLAYRCLGFSAHRGSHLLAASVGSHHPSARTGQRPAN